MRHFSPTVSFEATIYALAWINYDLIKSGVAENDAKFKFQPHISIYNHCSLSIKHPLIYLHVILKVKMLDKIMCSNRRIKAGTKAEHKMAANHLKHKYIHM